VGYAAVSGPETLLARYEIAAADQHTHHHR